MKVLDLQCGRQHVFEGWFGSEDDFQDQQLRGLVQCPMCGDAAISKRLSAPRLNLGSAREKSGETSREQSREQSSEDAAPARQELVAVPQANPELASAWLALTKRILANTDDVGDRFAEEARRIHYGETKERSIRGKATIDETHALIEEGIAVMPLLVPDALKGPLQ